MDRLASRSQNVDLKRENGQVVSATTQLKLLAPDGKRRFADMLDYNGAEYIAIDSDVVIKKPANIDFAAAASIPLVGLTTVQCFDKARLKAGDKVLIHAGSGGVGTFAIQYASQLADIKTLIEKQLIKPVIDKVYPLSNAVEALLHQKSGRAKGKIVIGMKS